MPIVGHTVFMNVPGESSRRILHPTTVTQINGADGYTVLPEDQSLSIEVDHEYLLFYERRRRFMQQPAKVEALMESESGTVVALKTIGEPIDAESRQCYRVCTIFSDLYAAFDGEDNCSLRDVSVTGFAVTSSRDNRLEVGRVVDARLQHEGKVYSGKASVQSIARTPDGLTRYGVNCVKDGNGPATLTRGVQQISMAIQRQQLSRLAGGA